ncbi:MAG: T9SS type A sorting domain-containing protein, partial [Bacteroidia bacterium]|nr:T9SS type A sorting domain-containing protein [Bacteroidia bacterium]
AWAKTCTVTRGWQHIANTSLGFANVGVDSNGIGKAGENPIVSLGDGGTAVLTFDRPIKNGLGYDFAVFENAFSDHFLELAFVEVSSDGVNYFRFPATSNVQYTTQIGPYDEMGEPEKINNLAGKYRVNYGTPFDLEELKNKPGLNVNAITHIKIIDVVGCVQAPYASHDDSFSIINDPYPTDFGNGGFDLDAVGVIYQQEVGLSENELLNSLFVYPNPCSTNLNIVNATEGEKTIVLFNQLGEEKINVSTNSININLNLSELNKGLYHLKINSERGVIFKKILIN